MDRGFIHAQLEWTLGRVQVIRWDVGDGRTLSLNAPDEDMWGDGGMPTVQAVNLEELDELIAVLQEHRAWLDPAHVDPQTGNYPADPVNNYRIVRWSEPDEEGQLGYDVFFDGDERAERVEDSVAWAPTYQGALEIISDIEDHRGNS